MTYKTLLKKLEAKRAEVEPVHYTNTAYVMGMEEVEVVIRALKKLMKKKPA